MRIARAAGLAALALTALIALAPAAQAAKPQYFVSLGDSYAVGYQDSLGHTTHHGPADQLVPLARKRGYHYKLVNFGCGGATSGSMLHDKGCDPAALAPGAKGYPGKTQVQAAVAFMRKHPRPDRARHGLDRRQRRHRVHPAERPPGLRARQAMKKVSRNLKTTVKRLRAAGGKQMRLIGSTYPDVVLGGWVRPDTFGTAGPTIATESLTSFAESINPGLRRAYASAGGAFVDVTRATGAYGPFTTRHTKKYGDIPVPVAKVCTLTYFCSRLGIHMSTRGYHIIARLEAAKLPRRS